MVQLVLLNVSVFIFCVIINQPSRFSECEAPITLLNIGSFKPAFLPQFCVLCVRENRFENGIKEDKNAKICIL